MTKTWIPRRFGEHKAHSKINKLAANELQKGDILIAKEWGNTALDAAFVRAGQAVFSHVHHGSSQSEHVLINCADGATLTIESLSQGLRIDDRVLARDHVVYGCTDRRLAEEASNVAKVLSGVAQISVNIEEDDSPEVAQARRVATWGKHYEENKSVVKYRSMAGMSASVFRSKRQGHFAKGRLRRLYEIVYGGKSAAGVKMICSEFVASCYEVAALRINEKLGVDPQPFGAGVDPRALTAKALESVLQRSGSKFKLAGSFRGTVPQSSKAMQEEREGLKKVLELYQRACDERGGKLSAEQAYNHLICDHATYILYKHDMLKSLDEWNLRVAAAYRAGYLRALL